MGREQEPAPPVAAAERVRELSERAYARVRELTAGCDAGTTLAVLEALGERLREERTALSGIADRIRLASDRIPRTLDPGALARQHAALNDLAVQLFANDRSVPELLELCTRYRDRLLVQALRITEQELGTPPCPYAVGCLGSEGRMEQTITTDQDNLIVFQEAARRPYFERFARRVNERLGELGVAPCSGRIMMGEPAWQGTYDDWAGRIDTTVAFRGDDQDHRRQLLNIIILSDLRFIHGSRSLLQRVGSHFFRRVHENVPVLYDMAQACVSMPLALGLFGRFRLEKSGPHRGRFSIKLLGWAPLVLAVRVLALKEGIRETHTLHRIEALHIHHRIDRQLQTDLVAAHDLLTRLKIECQIRHRDRTSHDTYYLSPEDLTAGDRQQLREVLHTVEKFQKLVHSSFMFPT